MAISETEIGKKQAPPEGYRSGEENPALVKESQGLKLEAFGYKTIVGDDYLLFSITGTLGGQTIRIHKLTPPWRLGINQELVGFLNGQRMSPEDTARIFDAYYSTQKDGNSEERILDEPFKGRGSWDHPSSYFHEVLSQPRPLPE